MLAIQSSLTWVRSWMARAARACPTDSSTWPLRPRRRDRATANRARNRESAGAWRLGALQHVQVVACASDVPGQQQVNGQAQQPVRGVGQHRGRHRAQIQWRRQRRVAQEISDDALLQQGQGAVGLPGRQEVAGRVPGVAHRLEPLGGPQLEGLFAGPVPGPQFGVQQLADQMVVAEDRPVLVEGHQEQAVPVDAPQQRGRVLAPGDRGARVRGQLAQDGRVQHEPGYLGGLLIEDLGGEVLGDLVAAELQRPPGPRRICAAAQRQRGHLQRCGPALASLVQQRRVVGRDLDTEVGQEVPAFRQREMQVTVAEFAQFPGHPQPVQPQRRVNPAGQHELGGVGRPALDQVGHGARDRGGCVVEVIDHDRRPGRAAGPRRWRSTR